MGIRNLISRLFTADQRTAAPRKAAKLEVITGGLTGTPFEQMHQLLGLTPPVEPALTQGDEDDESELAEQVLVHFRANQPAPTASQVTSLEVLNQVAKGDVPLAALTRLVQRDPALTVGVLKVANSPAFRGAQPIETLRDGITRLGSEEVARVAGTFAARALFQPQLKLEQRWLSATFNRYHAEAMATAMVSSAWAQRRKGARADLVWLAGLLHDIGRSCALRSLGGLMLGKGHLPDELVERVIDVVHVEAGGDIHQHWELPQFATVAAVRHHELSLPAEGFGELHLVRLVSALVRYQNDRSRAELAKAEIDSSAKALAIDGYTLRTIWTDATRALATVTSC
jgi:HD-like signal output (HDOD) protein